MITCHVLWISWYRNQNIRVEELNSLKPINYKVTKFVDKHLYFAKNVEIKRNVLKLNELNVSDKLKIKSQDKMIKFALGSINEKNQLFFNSAITLTNNGIKTHQLTVNKLKFPNVIVEGSESLQFYKNLLFVEINGEIHVKRINLNLDNQSSEQLVLTSYNETLQFSKPASNIKWDSEFSRLQNDNDVHLIMFRNANSLNITSLKRNDLYSKTVGIKYNFLHFGVNTKVFCFFDLNKLFIKTLAKNNVYNNYMISVTHDEIHLTLIDDITVKFEELFVNLSNFTSFDVAFFHDNVINVVYENMNNEKSYYLCRIRDNFAYKHLSYKTDTSLKQVKNDLSLIFIDKSKELMKCSHFKINLTDGMVHDLLTLNADGQLTLSSINYNVNTANVKQDLLLITLNVETHSLQQSQIYDFNKNVNLRYLLAIGTNSNKNDLLKIDFVIHPLHFKSCYRKNAIDDAQKEITFLFYWNKTQKRLMCNYYVNNKLQIDENSLLVLQKLLYTYNLEPKVLNKALAFDLSFYVPITSYKQNQSLNIVGWHQNKLHLNTLKIPLNFQDINSDGYDKYYLLSLKSNRELYLYDLSFQTNSTLVKSWPNLLCLSTINNDSIKVCKLNTSNNFEISQTHHHFLIIFNQQDNVINSVYVHFDNVNLDDVNIIILNSKELHILSVLKLILDYLNTHYPMFLKLTQSFLNQENDYDKLISFTKTKNSFDLVDPEKNNNIQIMTTSVQPLVFKPLIQQNSHIFPETIQHLTCKYILSLNLNEYDLCLLANKHQILNTLLKLRNNNVDIEDEKQNQLVTYDTRDGELKTMINFDIFPVNSNIEKSQIYFQDKNGQSKWESVNKWKRLTERDMIITSFKNKISWEPKIYKQSIPLFYITQFYGLLQTPCLKNTIISFNFDLTIQVTPITSPQKYIDHMFVRLTCECNNQSKTVMLKLTYFVQTFDLMMFFKIVKNSKIINYSIKVELLRHSKYVKIGHVGINMTHRLNFVVTKY